MSLGAALVECAQDFVRRMDDFTNLHILGQKGGVPGIVKHYATRLEVIGCQHARLDGLKELGAPRAQQKTACHQL
ncbi:hypothetical protein ABBQ38_010566 [Trebouxia sp. C0009 RCD-2024]